MKNKIKSKKRLYLFIPLMAVLVLMNVAAFAVAVIGKNIWLFIACFFLLVLTLVGIYMIASLSKSINKFYQTMEKQLSPYTNKSLRDFPLPVLVTRRRGGEIIWYNNQMREKVFDGSAALGTAWQNIFRRSICRPNVRCRGMESSTMDTSTPPTTHLPARRTTA